MATGDSAWAWVLPLGLLAIALVSVPLRMLEPEGLPRYRALRSELVTLERANAETRRELGALRRRVRALRTDPSEVERIARDELGMVREGEILFEFDEPPAARP